MSDILPAERQIAPELHRSVSLRATNRAVVTLQQMAIDIRSRSGATMSRSAILRSLIQWLETCDLDTRGISSPHELHDLLLDRILGRST
ncbi:MAG: hypothetical protein ACRD16_01700 [Thermoanaerobaculia bacterium]